MKKKSILISLILVSVCVLIIIVLVISSFSQSKKTKEESNMVDRSTEEAAVKKNIPGTDYKVNTSYKLEEEKHFNGLTLTRNHLTRTNKGVCSFTSVITNKTNKNWKSQKIKIVFLTKYGKELGIMESEIPGLAINENTVIFAYTPKNVIEAYDFKIVIK